MKFFKFIHFLVFFLAIHYSLFAQVTFGPRIGVNVTNYNKAVSLDSSNFKNYANLHAGLTFDIWLHKKISLQTGLFYSSGGQELKKEYSFSKNLVNVIDSSLFKYSGTFQTNVIKLPLLITFDSDGKPGLGKDDGIFDAFRAEAGVYFAYRLNSKINHSFDYKVLSYDSLGVSNEIGSYSNKQNRNLTDKDNLNPFDMGLQFGLGIEKSIGIGTFLINFNYNLGLVDLYKLDNSQKPQGYKPVKYKDWSISLTYFFPSFNNNSN